jgi:hypothetical protein
VDSSSWVWLWRNRWSGELQFPEVVSNDIRVVAVIEEQVSSRLWDLGDDAGQELESVDFFELGEELARIVVRGLGSVENVSGGFGRLHRERLTGERSM